VIPGYIMPICCAEEVEKKIKVQVIIGLETTDFLNRVHAWIVFRKVCVNICLSFCTHVSKTLEAKSSLYTRIEDYTEPVLNL